MFVAFRNYIFAAKVATFTVQLTPQVSEERVQYKPCLPQLVNENSSKSAMGYYKRILYVGHNNGLIQAWKVVYDVR